MLEVPPWTGRAFPGALHSHKFSYENPQKNKETKTLSISNLIITNNNVDYHTLTISGNCFMIDLDRTNSYFHFLLDQIGQYEYVRSVIPDVKLLVITKDSEQYPADTFTQLSSIVNEILSRYDAYENRVINLSHYSEVVIERMYFCSKHFNYYTTNISIFHSMSTEWKPIIDSIRSGPMYSPRKGGLSRKIFISKRSENNKVRKMKKIFDKKLSDRTPEEKQLIASFAGGDNSIKMRYRLISESDEIMIENFFIEHGYEIIFPENHSFQEQINIFHSATHIASFKGASTVNSIFSKPGSKVFMLNTSDKYRFPHEDILREAGMEVYSLPEIPKVRNKEDTPFYGRDILKSLSDYLDIL